jgi:hypothetical protein
MEGSYSTHASWFAKFTPASFTPFTDCNIDSTLTAQAAQVISRTGNVCLIKEEFLCDVRGITLVSVWFIKYLFAKLEMLYGGIVIQFVRTVIKVSVADVVFMYGSEC